MSQQYFNFGDTGETAKGVIDDNFLELYGLVGDKLIVQGNEASFTTLNTNQPPATHVDEYWIVNTATGTYLLGTRKSAGIYKSDGTAWIYTGINTSYHLEDTNWVLSDGGNSSKKMQFQLDQITTGNTRIITVANYDQNLAYPVFQTSTLDSSYTSLGNEAVGTTYWDKDNHTTSTVLENGVVMQNGTELPRYGKNASGVIIPNGRAVSMTGLPGQFTTWELTDFTDEVSTKAFVGISTQEIDINAFGYVNTTGLVRDFDTSAWTEKSILYGKCTSTIGELTTTYPDADCYVVKIGIVEYTHAINGRINLSSSIYPKLQDLSGINGTPLTTTGQIVVWNQANDYFDFDYNILDYSAALNLAELAVGSSTDNSTFESDGTLVFNGTATVWEDLNFGVIRSGGPAATRPNDVTVNNVYYKEFTSSNNQTCGDAVELPHEAKLSASLYPHLHVFLKPGESAGTTGVTFTIYWEIREGSGTTNGNVTLSATSAELSANGNKVDIYNGSFAGPISLGAQLSLRLDRTAGNAGDIIVTTYGVHYEIDSVGSHEIVVK